MGRLTPSSANEISVLHDADAGVPVDFEASSARQVDSGVRAPSERHAELHTELRVESHAEHPAERHPERPTERHSERPAERHPERRAERYPERYAEGFRSERGSFERSSFERGSSERGSSERGSHSRNSHASPHRRAERAHTLPQAPEARRYEVVFEEERIDPDVRKVVRRLVRHGYEAYLVGGCVRDLLLDRRPKDFDVATDARPEEIRELFRNSRIIGRRFRLVHVLFQGGKVIEVATFRRNPKDDADESAELLIRSDNVFGVAHEDAVRRDFTMNALFYDLEARQILDWVGGMDDVRRTVVHTIGDPETRFREDPVRILRALKFAGRLGFAITPDVYDAIVYCREALALAARPRLSEEILRLLRGGQARRTMYLAWETGVLDVLLPELSALLYDEGEDGAGQRFWRLLDYIDKRTAEDKPLDDTALWTILLLEPMKEACEGARDRSTAVGEFLEAIVERLAVSRRYADGMRRIVALLPRLLSGRAGRFAKTDVFDSALDVVAADLASRGESHTVAERLRAAVGGRRGRNDRRGRREEM